MKKLILLASLLIPSISLAWTDAASPVGTIQNRDTIQTGATFYVDKGIMDLFVASATDSGTSTILSYHTKYTDAFMDDKYGILHVCIPPDDNGGAGYIAKGFYLMASTLPYVDGQAVATPYISMTPSDSGGDASMSLNADGGNLALDFDGLSFTTDDNAHQIATSQTNGITLNSDEAVKITGTLGSQVGKLMIVDNDGFTPLDGVTLKSPEDVTVSNLEFTLPGQDGSSGSVLVTDGSGILSFSSAPALYSVSITSIPTGSSAVTKDYVDLAVSSLDLNMYFSTDVAAGLSNYNIMYASASSFPSASTTSAGITSPTTTRVFSFITAVGQPHLPRLLAGNYDTHMHLNKTGTRGVTITCSIATATPAGVVAPAIATSTVSSALTTTVAEYNHHITIDNEVTLSTGDRIVVNVFAVTDGAPTGSATTVTMTTGGTADSHFSIIVESIELQTIFVPYTGAEQDVNLGSNKIVMSGVTISSQVATGVLGLTIDGGGSAITTGSKGFLYVPYTCTISSWVVIADQSGSAVVDIKRSTWAGFPTTTSIVGGSGNKPTLSTQQNNSAAPASWTSTTINAGDVIEFNVDSAATVTRVNLTLVVTKT